MSDNTDPQQNFGFYLHLLNVLRLHCSFAEHIQTHWNHIFTLPRFDGSRSPHSYDFHRWPHFLHTCVRVYFPEVLWDERSLISVFQFLCQSHCDSIHGVEPQPNHECYIQCPCCRILNCEYFFVRVRSINEAVDMADCSMSCSAAANQLHIWWARDLVSSSLPVNSACSHSFFSGHASSSNNRPITMGSERVMSSMNYKRTTRSGVHVQVSFRAFLFSLQRSEHSTLNGRWRHSRMRKTTRMIFSPRWKKQARRMWTLVTLKGRDHSEIPFTYRWILRHTRSAYISWKMDTRAAILVAAGVV